MIGSHQSQVHRFGLLLVLGRAVTIPTLCYQLAQKLLAKPLFSAVWCKHPSELNSRTIGGAAIFGIGWGISGVCPGPEIAGIGSGNRPLFLVILAIFSGAWKHGRFFGR